MWQYGIIQRRCEDNLNSFSHHLRWCGLLHLVMWWMHAPTFNKWQKKKKKTLHMLTHGAMWGRVLTSLVACINDNFCDIRERNVTRRSEIWTTKIRTLGFRNIRECVTLWGLILRILGCNLCEFLRHYNQVFIELPILILTFLIVISMLHVTWHGRVWQTGWIAFRGLTKNVDERISWILVKKIKKWK